MCIVPRKKVMEPSFNDKRNLFIEKMSETPPIMPCRAVPCRAVPFVTFFCCLQKNKEPPVTPVFEMLQANFF